MNGLQTRLHVGEIQRLLKEYEPAAICIQHVHFNIANIGCYFLASSSVPSVNSLGTAIYVHNKVMYDKITFQTSVFQISGIKIYIDKNNHFTLYNIYNQPSCNYDLAYIENVLPSVRGNFMLVGDFNAHNPLWDMNIEDADDNGRKIEYFIEDKNLCLLNDPETSTYYSKTHGTFSSIDLSICSLSMVDRFEWFALDDLYTSDHFPIIISCLDSNPYEHIQYYNSTKADWDSYHQFTRQIPPFNGLQDHDDTENFIVNFITKAADKSMPKTASHPLKHCVPWWSETLNNLVKEKTTLGRRLATLNKRFKKLLNKQVKCSNDVSTMVTISLEINLIKPHYNKISAKFRKEVIQGKIISWQKYISSITEKTPIHKIWEKFRKINGAYTKSPRHPLLHNGIKVYDNKQIANILGGTIAHISSFNNLDEHFKKTKYKVESVPLNFETEEDLFYNKQFTDEEFAHALNNCDSSSPGKDLINFDMIKHLAPLAKSYLLQFYNHLWSRRKFPKSWRHAIVIPVPKPGKDPSHPNNYRPISLTSCLCKLLEKMVNNRLTWCLRKNNVISSTQFGSQLGRSTLDSLAQLEDHIRRGFERKRITAAIFFDIQKAYDTTWRHLILKTLHQNEFRGNLPIFIKNFLEERTFQTRIENVFSDTFCLDCGVPQGSVLSGTLFILAINDIVRQLPQGVQNNLYVDDFAIYYSSNNLRHIQRILNLSISNIVKWTESVGFHLSIEKTQAILFYKDSRWKKNQEIRLEIKDKIIPISESVKFLGLVFDTHLNWKSHVSYIKTKCKLALNLIKKLAHTVWGAKRIVLIHIYKALIQSVLDYGSPIYGSASDHVLNQLNPIQTQGLRICTGAFKSSPNYSVICESGQLPLSIHRDFVTMKNGLKMLSSDSPTQSLFNLNDIFINNHSPSFPIRANRLLSTVINGSALNFLPFYITPPPWTLAGVNVCSHLYYLSKSSAYLPSHHRQHTLEHIRSKGLHHEIYTDGSKSAQGVGFAAISSSQSYEVSLPKEASVFTAELMAILYALKIAEVIQNKCVIYSDSRSAVEALKHYNHPHQLVKQIKVFYNILYQKGIDVQICWLPAHVGIGGNEKADNAAKRAIASSIKVDKIPIGDYINAIRPFAWERWQNLWNEQPATNKLREIKTSVKPWPSSFQVTRKHEVTLTRLRIGHTKLTHGYLMNTTDTPPVCTQCNVYLSIKHIFSTCTQYANIRRNLLGNTTFKDILADDVHVNVNNIMKFLQECNILHEL